MFHKTPNFFTSFFKIFFNLHKISNLQRRKLENILHFLCLNNYIYKFVFRVYFVELIQ